MEKQNNKEILSYIETPYFLIDEIELSSNVKKLREALNHYWCNSIIAYSFKANALPWLLTYFKNCSLYAEVSSDDEYKLALMTGYEKHKIIYNGPCKTKETFLDALRNQGIVNIDSQRELLWLKDLTGPEQKEYKVGLRVNFDLEKCCKGETSMGDEGSRFGFCYENGELEKVINFIRDLSNVKLAGLHFHCSSKTRSIEIYRAIARIACEITKTYGLTFEYLDIGGGFYGGMMSKPQFTDYFDVVAKELNNDFNNEETVLIIEPGTSLVSSTFRYVTKVMDVKQTITKTFAVTDGSRIHIDPLMKKTSYLFEVIYEQENKSMIVGEQVITGFTCMEFDRLFVLKEYPKLSVGDHIIYNKVGAYTLCLSPLFIKYFPAVYVEKMGGYKLIRTKGAAQEYYNMNYIT